MSDLFLPLYVAIFLSALIITVIAERLLIPRLRRKAEQPIYEGGPAWHKSKAGTPTMGGVAFLIAIVSTLSVCCVFLAVNKRISEAWLLLWTLVYATLNSLIGIIDDRRKIKKRKNDKGLTPTQKLIMQTLAAVGFIVCVGITCGVDTVMSFSHTEIDLGVLYYPFVAVVLVGITNCANLTDGIDGLASSVSFAIGVALFYISYALYPVASIIACALMGGSCGFLIFNLHPARIFMGDTGSLFLGSLIASVSLVLNNPVTVIMICSVYVIEGVSVIIQVIYFKATGKRLFRMAPLHHHLERCGWSENKICIVAIIITFIMSIPAFLAYIQ